MNPVRNSKNKKLFNTFNSIKYRHKISNGVKAIFAKNIGFCSGVKRALAIAEKSLKEDPRPIQFLGALIHNEEVIENLKKKGGIFISTLKEIRPGTLILRAHGEILDQNETEKNKVIIRDTTCPLVKKAQKAANSLFKEGYQVIIIGDKNHPEVKGIKKCAGKGTIVIESESQAQRLPKIKKIGVVSQTTQDINKVNKILKILKGKSKKINWSNTICPEVISRQKELDKISENCKGFLVIGSRSSANTRRLVERAKKLKKRVFWVNSLEELKNKKLKEISHLGVISGTSTPDWEIKKIKKYLEKYD